MTKVVKKEKISYLRPSNKNDTNIIEDIGYSYDYQNSYMNNNNDINTTLTNISNQLKNIAIMDKNKEQKLLNSSFRVTNRNKNINSFLDTINTDMNQRFHNLQAKRVFSIFFPRNIENINTNIDDIQKENLELKENIKFLLKQIKRYQKSGLTIEDMDINREQKIEKLEEEISELKNDILTYQNQIVMLNNSNNELKKENKELKDYMDNINIKESNERKNKFDDKYLEELGESNLKYNNINNYIYKNNFKKMKFNIGKKDEEENEMNSNSKLSEELLYEINQELFQGTHDQNNKNRNKSNLSEGKLYLKKNPVKNLTFNYEPIKRNIINQNNKRKNKFTTYSKNYLKSK